MEDVSVADKTYNENDFAKTSFQQGEWRWWASIWLGNTDKYFQKSMLELHR